MHKHEKYHSGIPYTSMKNITLVYYASLTTITYQIHSNTYMAVHTCQNNQSGQWQKPYFDLTYNLQIKLMTLWIFLCVFLSQSDI